MPLDHVTADGIELGKWRAIQLEALRQGTMPQRRITLIKQHNLLQDARDVEFH
ncbi:hypothetical protein OG948_58030 (plasmid) [Embleya sp. NBC_00888]|uniref:hypothetical protein n=1 Tax=Embleya sp. NBC_00888 TaxID=2975960 RepID=UPI002F915C31|nr:hypothetical protein OG948_58030 [Embleya sp. NBC_00888]